MFKLLVPALLVPALVAGATATVAPRPAAIPFERVAIYLEYNATDDDAEIVVDLKADAALERLAIFAPGGKPVLKLRSRDGEGLGINELVLETTEPALATVLAAYPPGLYRFVGRTHSGQELFSIAQLSHDLPAAPDILQPLDGEVGILDGSSAVWTCATPVASFLVELEQEDIGIELLSNVLGTTTSFAFPAGWLAPGLEHQLGIGARAANGNLVVTEIHFTAMP